MATTWTPELREEFRDHVNAFFDKHPELREGLSENMSSYWDSDAGNEMRKAMSEAATG